MEFNNKTKKANIGIQTFFFIMMSILMIWIIVFGIQKIFLIDDQLSEQDRIDIQNKLEDSFNYCSDPLNQGNIKVLEFKNKLFNSICVISNLINTGNSNLNDELQTINDSGHNIVILKTTSSSSGDITDYKIIKSFNSTFTKGGCSFDTNNTGKLRYELIC